MGNRDRRLRTWAGNVKGNDLLECSFLPLTLSAKFNSLDGERSTERNRDGSV